MLLGVNMQTSFMHPPFGFALFYLRSVAPHDDYVDQVTGSAIEQVTTGQIYWGAMPFVVIQVVMVGLVIAFPRHGHPLPRRPGPARPQHHQRPDSGLGSGATNFGTGPNFGTTPGPNFGPARRL